VVYTLRYIPGGVYALPKVYPGGVYALPKVYPGGMPLRYLRVVYASQVPQGGVCAGWVYQGGVCAGWV